MLRSTLWSTLARSHARSGDAAAIAGYLGDKPVFDTAVPDFAEAYAALNAADYPRLLAAIEAGELPCVRDR